MSKKVSYQEHFQGAYKQSYAVVVHLLQAGAINIPGHWLPLPEEVLNVSQGSVATR